MLWRHKRLFLLTLIALTITLYWGCSQPDDVFTDKSVTYIELNAERFPSTPPGMIYELWVANGPVDVETPDATSIEKFAYDFDLDKYYDENGVERPAGNKFSLQGDIMSYGWLFIAVQRADGSDIGPGSVMLLDTITDPGDNPIDLIFPMADSMGLVSVEYNMETPSDGRDSASDGAGLWFTYYAEKRTAIVDTTAIDWRATSIDTIYKDQFSDDEGPCKTSITNILNDTTITVERIFGFDTVSQEVVRYDQTTVTVCDSGQGNLLTTSVTLEFDTELQDTLTYDDFIQVSLELPDYRDYGWQYKGWVVSDIISDGGAEVGTMTPPAWKFYNTANDSLIRGIDGGLLPTGKFYDLQLPDDGNPYVDSPVRVPPFPGEDFIQNLPGGASGPLFLVPDNSGDVRGCVFITLEPDNYATDTTNFPLLIMTRDLPGRRYDVQDDEQQFRMWNRTNYNRNVTVGLPRVGTTITRL